MSRSKKTSHRRIVVREVEYRWTASGDDGYINLTVKPSNRIGPVIETTFSYGETWVPRGEGVWNSAGDQIVITNRIVKRVIEHAIDDLEYNPIEKGKLLRIHCVEDAIDMSDVIRRSDT